MATWTLRDEHGTTEIHRVTETPAAWLLSLPPQEVTYYIPRPRQGETGSEWVGRVSARVMLHKRLEGLHPLVPSVAGTAAWARPPAGASWIPVYGTRVTPGTTLAQVPEVTLDLFWQTVPPLVELLRQAERRGLLLKRLLPGHILIQNGKPAALNAPGEWDLKLPDLTHDHTRVAAHLIHWFLCALRQKRGAPEPPTTLWAICARGLEGGYARSGLFNLEQDLQTAAAKNPDNNTADRKTCLIIDVDGIKAATGAYLHPWLTLEALWEPGQTLDPVLAVHGTPVPGRLAAAWQEARFTPHPVPHFGPKDVADLVRSTAPRGQKVLLVSGRRDLTYTCSALQRAGYPCGVIGFQCEAGVPVADGMERLKAALYLAAGSDPTELAEGGVNRLAQSL
jgi:hypothetical protein